MRIFHVFGMIFSIVVLLFYTYNAGYAECNATYTGSAGKFLQDCAGDATNVGISPDLSGPSDIQELIVSVAKKVIQFGALFAIGAIVFSGIQYTTSYGDDEKVKKAKTTGIYALIGLVLLLVAFPLVNIIVDFVYVIGSAK